MRSNIPFLVGLFASVVISTSLLHKVNAKNVVRQSLVRVPFGETVTLLCESNDNDHSFFYWSVNEGGVIIGPSNSYDNGKFRYEVLSGNLTVKAVSKQEEGVYSCVSRGVRKDDLKVRNVRMVVETDWEEVLEDDPNKLAKMSRKNNKNNYILKPKNVKLLTKGYADPYHTLTTGFDSIRLELENENLRQTILMLEGRNTILDQHCSLLKEKNLYFEARLKDANHQVKELQSGDISEEQDQESNSDEKTTSFMDRVSGFVFGFALPKVGTVLGKVREKCMEMRDHGDIDCPMRKNVHFKQKLEELKVNLFRVAVVLGSLIVLSGVGYAGYKIWKTRYRHPSYLMSSDEEEEEVEELFRAPGTSGTSNSILKTNSTDSFETPGISTDFRSILDTATKK